MAQRKNRNPMPLPGRTGEAADPAPPPLPARRPPPAPPTSNSVHVTKLNAAEESEDDDSYEEPSNARLNEPEQELYDDFEEEGPPVSPYNPSKSAPPPPQEIYDDFEEQSEIYEEADESGPEIKNLTPSGKPPPLPPGDSRKRGSQIPLPPLPTTSKRELPPTPAQDIYESTDAFENEETQSASPPPPPPKHPTSQRKTPDDKKAPVPPAFGIGPIGQDTLKGALKGLRKVSKEEKPEEKNNNDKNKSPSESLPFPVQLKKTPFQDKSKDSAKENGGVISENHHGNGDTNNNSRPVPPVKDLKPRAHLPKIPPVEPMAPKIPPTKKENEESTPNSNVSEIKNNFGGMSSVINDIPKKPALPSKPLATPKPPADNKGVKIIQLTHRKPAPPSPLSPPSPEEFPPPPPPEVFHDDEIYDDATSQEWDPLSKFPWYHGLVERKDCEKLLKSVGKDGTFLVRKSTKSPEQPYTMAVLFQDRVNNLKVRLRNDGRIALGETKANEISFKDVVGMIEHHKKNPVLLIGSQKGEITLNGSPGKV